MNYFLLQSRVSSVELLDQLPRSLLHKIVDGFPSVVNGREACPSHSVERRAVAILKKKKNFASSNFQLVFFVYISSIFFFPYIISSCYCVHP